MTPEQLPNYYDPNSAGAHANGAAQDDAAKRLLSLLGSKLRDLSWQDQAECRDDEYLMNNVFWPAGYRTESKEDRVEREAYAKRICGACAVQKECLTYALANRIDSGIWGGKTEEERKRMLGRSRRKSAPSV